MTPAPTVSKMAFRLRETVDSARVLERSLQESSRLVPPRAESLRPLAVPVAASPSWPRPAQRRKDGKPGQKEHDQHPHPPGRDDQDEHYRGSRSRSGRRGGPPAPVRALSRSGGERWAFIALLAAGSIQVALLLEPVRRELLAPSYGHDHPSVWSIAPTRIATLLAAGRSVMLSRSTS